MAALIRWDRRFPRGKAWRYVENRDAWSNHSSQQEFEHELINRKTTWLLTTQAIFFAAYGVTFQNGIEPDDVSSFRSVIAVVGAVVAFLMGVGVAGLVKAKHTSWKDYQAHFAEHPGSLPKPLDERELQWGVRTSVTWFSLAPDVLLPLVFTVAWIAILRMM